MKTDLDKALVVLSGGQDSTTCLFWALENYSEVHAITFDYNQRHKIEIRAAKDVAGIAGITHRHNIVTIPPELLLSSSPLTSNNKLSEYESMQQMEEKVGNKVEDTFVPMRNSMFLTIAANRAVHLGIGNIVTGVCESDNANYPDCTGDFINAIEAAINKSLGEECIAIRTPLIDTDKKGIVELALDLPMLCMKALAYSHTSYDGLYPPTGKNHSNILRAHGFEQAGWPDPLVVRAHMEGLMPYPNTANYRNQDRLNVIKKAIL